MRTLKYASKANVHTVIEHYQNSSPAFFDDVCDGIYEYTTQNGYLNMGTWIGQAAKTHYK